MTSKKSQETAVVGKTATGKDAKSAQDEGRKQALDLALAQITKQFGDGSIMKSATVGAS